MARKAYVQYLTEDDRVHVSFYEKRGMILEFSVNYSARIEGRWREVFRVDNCHGQLPHMHRYYVHRRQFKIVLGNSSEEAFTKAKQYVVSEFENIKRNYLQVRAQRRI